MNNDSEADASEPPSSNAWIIEFNLDDLHEEQAGDSDPFEAESPQAAAQAVGIDLAMIEQAISAVLEHHEIESAEISVAIVTGPRMRELNRQYLKHDFDTDVLSFCLGEEESDAVQAQLILSLDYAAGQARDLSQQAGRSITASDELCLYAVHGTLHVLGYDDHSDQDREDMRAAEAVMLARIGKTSWWPDECGSDADHLDADHVDADRPEGSR